ncbi:MAG: acyltransferase [Xanthomonadales bacterium]|nr:acyltransferase [Xanthomonadales bacterium]NNL96538.1 acyltransferase [Xanthomonadales bacterium]
MMAWISRWIYKLLGWTTEVEYPDTKKYVLIVAPHTSNWDFPLGMLAARILRLKVHYLGKHTLFEGPFGWFFKYLGGIPVRRDKVHNMSQQMAQRFAEADELVLAIAPEGTRKKTRHWKMGFYHIARAAQVPIVMAYLDYGNKKVRMGGAFYPGEDMQETLETVRAFFVGVQGRYPDKQGLIRARPPKEAAK